MEQWWLLFETPFNDLNQELQQMLYHSFLNFAYKEVNFLLKDRALTEDVIQDAFLKVISKRHQIKNASGTKQWIRRLIRNTALDFLKKTKKYRYMLDIEDVRDIEVAVDRVHYQQAASIADCIEINMRNQMLHDSIMELKYDYRILLRMFYIEEKSIKQIAEELELNEQAVTQRLVRARKKLYVQFSQRWVDQDE